MATPPASRDDPLDTVITSSISRIVAAFTPVLAGVLGAVFYWLQDAIGINLQVDPAAAAAFIGSIILGACLLGYKWLEGRAGYERVAQELTVMHRAGQAAAGPPPAPPGVREVT